MATTQTRTGVAVRAEHAVKVYGTADTAVTALDDVSIAFPAGRFTAIMGPSGPASRRFCTAWPGSTRSPPGRSSSARLSWAPCPTGS
jgi:hypothetical protein